MSSNSAEVLQSFLVSLGFTLDAIGERKFQGVMGKVAKTSASVSKNVIGVAAAAQTMVAAVSYEYEKLFYSSKRVGDSAKNLQSFSFGTRQIGINAESATESLASMAQIVRNNPAMSGLFKSITGNTSSGTVKDMISLVKTLRDTYGSAGSSNYFVGASRAGAFGLSEDQYNLMTQPGAIEKLEAAQAHLIELHRQAGISIEHEVEVSKDFMNTWREIEARMGIVVTIATKQLRPAFKGFSSLLKDALGMDAPWVPGYQSPVSTQDYGGKSKAIGGAGGSSRAVLEMQATLAANKYGIPPGLFKALISKESGWNPNASAPGSTAKGLTQLLKGTASDMGVGNAFDPEQNLEGGAKYLSQQFSKFGNWRDALSAYNQGPGNYKLGEGRQYADSVMSKAGMGGASVNVSQTNHITTRDDPQAIAQATSSAMDRSTQDIVRAAGAYN